jgi:hypothetical protein
MTCPHEFIDQELAIVADGLCPLCLQGRIVDLTLEADAAVQNMERHRIALRKAEARAVTDERKAFEAWVLRQRLRILPLAMGGAETFYLNECTDIAWDAWQARAALTQGEATAAPLPSSPESAGSHSPKSGWQKAGYDADHLLGITRPAVGVAQEAGDEP